MSEKTERRFGVILAPFSSKECNRNARMTPKRRSVFSLIFIVNCISKFNLIKIYYFVNIPRTEIFIVL